MPFSPTNDFNSWKSDPVGFFGRNRELCTRIIRKIWGFGDLGTREFEQKVIEISKRMATEAILNRMNEYSGKAVFLVYYLKILEKIS